MEMPNDLFKPCKSGRAGQAFPNFCPENVREKGGFRRVKPVYMRELLYTDETQLYGKELPA